MASARKHTDKLLEMVEEGVIDTKYALMACLKYMSESEVEDMCHLNEFDVEDENEDE